MNVNRKGRYAAAVKRTCCSCEKDSTSGCRSKDSLFLCLRDNEPL